MSTNFFPAPSTIVPGNPYQPGTMEFNGWNSQRLTERANQANLLNPGSNPFGNFATPTPGGTITTRDAKGNMVQSAGLWGPTGQFNATGYWGGNGTPNPTGDLLTGGGTAASPTGPRVRGPQAGGGFPAGYVPPSGLEGNLPGFNPTGNPIPGGGVSSTPPTTGPGGTPAAGSSWVPSDTTSRGGSRSGVSGAVIPGAEPRTVSTGLTPIAGGAAPTPGVSPSSPGGVPLVPPIPATGQPGTPGLAVGGHGGSGIVAAGTPPGGGFTGPEGGINPTTGLPTGYFMSLSPGMQNPVAAPTFNTFMGQRLAAFQSPFITPGAFVADIVGQLGPDASMTPFAQFAKDYAGTHPDDPEIAARGGIQGFIDYYNQPQFALSTFRPDLAAIANGWGSGVAGSFKGLGNDGLKLLTSDDPMRQPAFDASPQQVAQSLLLNGVNPRSGNFSNQLGIANSNLQHLNGASYMGGTPANPATFITDPGSVSSLDQLIFNPGSSGAAGTPGAGSPPIASRGGGDTPIGGPADPLMQQLASMFFGPNVTPDQQMAFNSGDMGYLRQLVAGGGMPTAVSPAWNAAIAAMKKNEDRQFADLTESFGVSGNRFSNAFGTAAGDFKNQSTLNQNALLAQMLQSSLENAANRTLTGAQTLGGFAQQSLSQLSGQNFQASQAQQAQRLQAALAMLGVGSSAASQLSSQGASGASQLQQGAIQGATGLFNTENQAMMTEIARQLQLQGMGMSGANSLSQLWQSNLGLGSQLGGQQFGINQQMLNNMYQEWMRQQPQYNPLLSMFNQGANAYPQLFGQSFQPSQLGSILGGLGSILGASPEIIKGIMNLFGGGSGSGSSGGGLNLGSIFGGGTNNPFIFNSGGGGLFGSGGFGSFLNF